MWAFRIASYSRARVGLVGLTFEVGLWLRLWLIEYRMRTRRDCRAWMQKGRREVHVSSCRGFSISGFGFWVSGLGFTVWTSGQAKSSRELRLQTMSSG